MKQPLWILNISLLFLLLLVLSFIYIFRPQIIQREKIIPTIPVVLPKEAAIDYSVIYERDIFGTFHKEEPMAVADKKEVSDQIPMPPESVPFAIPKIPDPQFLDPLTISLTGIIMTDNADQNRALIYNIQMKEEMSYKVGDKIEDAQLVRIFAHKVIIIRSNGQQEVLYLRQEDADADAPSIVHGYWDHMIKSVANDVFIIDPYEFVRKVKSLAQLIDLLDLTTAYQAGKSIGCKIGSLSEESFAPVLGLVQGDIIESIGKIEATNTINNFKIYQYLTSVKKGEEIPVVINRSGERFTLTLKIDDINLSTLVDVQSKEARAIVRKKTSQEIGHEKEELMQQKYHFAPTAKELYDREKSQMWEQGMQGAESPHLKTRNAISGNV